MSPTLRPRLIVNADDLGQQPERDAAILRLHSLGAVSSATLVVNSPRAADAATRAISQGLPLGLHLNLSDGYAVDGASSLTHASGQLRGKSGLREALDRGEIAAIDLDAEILAQLARFQTLTGGPPTHLDGHHHCQVCPAVAAALVRCLPGNMARPALRLPLLSAAIESRDQLHRRFADDPAEQTFHARVQDEAALARDVFIKHDFRLPAGFFGPTLMGRAMTPEALRERLSRLLEQAAGIYELMCHPGYPAANGDAFAASVERQQEFDTLLTVFATLPPELRPLLPLTDFTALTI